MTEKDKEVEIESCPDPDQIIDCSDCVEKGLANCGWAKEQDHKKEKEREEKKVVDIPLLF